MSNAKPFEDNHKIINNIIYKLCIHHEENFPTEDPWIIMNESNFYKNKTSNDTFHPECKRCNIIRSSRRQKSLGIKRKIYRRNYYLNNMEEAKEQVTQWRKTNFNYYKKYTKEYLKNNPNKLREYAKNHNNHDITKTEWKNCCKVFNYECAYCGKTLEEQLEQNKEFFHKEHVYQDGYNDLRNCVPSCTLCNSYKSIKYVEEWYKAQKFYSKDRYDKIIWWINEGYKQYIEVKSPYKFKRRRELNEDGTYYYIHELWIFDEKRYLKECILESISKKDLNDFLKNRQ